MISNAQERAILYVRLLLFDVLSVHAVLYTFKVTSLHKIKQSPISDENEAFKKTADGATVSRALLDLIASHRPIRV